MNIKNYVQNLLLFNFRWKVINIQHKIDKTLKYFRFLDLVENCPVSECFLFFCNKKKKMIVYTQTMISILIGNIDIYINFVQLLWLNDIYNILIRADFY